MDQGVVSIAVSEQKKPAKPDGTGFAGGCVYFSAGPV